MAELKIKADSGGGTVSLKGPATTNSNAAVNVILPKASIDLSSAGTDGQFLKTDGAGTLSFATVTDTNTIGVGEADQWRLTTTFASAGTIITSNWERVDARGSAGPLGSGVSQSSGVFTFPSNGYWYVEFRATCAGTDCDWVFTKINSESSSYNPVAFNRSACKDADSYAYVGSQCLLDVTAYASQRLKFEVGAQNSIDWYGDSDYSDTSVMFIKLGDT